VLSSLPHRLLLAAVALVALTTAACGGASVYQPSKFANFDVNAAIEVDDEAIRKAFEAKPQMPSSPRVAFFTFDPTKEEDLAAMVRSLPGVTDTYAIPTVLVTGHGRLYEPQPWAPLPAQPPSIKSLRLLAARAHCDLLVVVDYGNRVDVDVNALAAFNVLIVPALFLPYRDLTERSYVDAFVIDTRNGYLYAHAEAHEEDKESAQTIYAKTDEVLESQWGRMRTDLKAKLAGVLAGEHPTWVTK
jgi:hypothetical protein